MNETEARENAARKLIEATPGIPSLPAAAMRAGRLAGDPDSSTDELAEVLGSDPALCAHLLKVANSAFFGLRSEVSSVRHAVMVLGRKTLRSVALAASIQTVFPRRAELRGFSPRALWSHSARVAGASSALAKVLKTADPDDAFVAGLVHDIGMLVMHQHPSFPEVAEAVANAAPEERDAVFREVEGRAMGAPHEDVGRVLMKQWAFPDVLAEAATFHHEPTRTEGDGRLLAAVVHAAEAVALHGEHGVDFPVPSREVAPDVLEILRTDPVRMDSCCEQILQAASEVDAAMAESRAAA